jgi:lon-related putative ATP-dependent protease
MSKPAELKPTDLRCICDPKTFSFKDTSEVEPLAEVIGQQRAVQAIDFGLNMKSPGYNIFVTGQEGTGKSTIVNDIVTQHAKELPTPNDACMVNNFKDEFRPNVIAVPSGKANSFKKQMNRLIEDLKLRLPEAFENESYQDKQTEIQKKYGDQQRTFLDELEASAEKKNLQLQRTQVGYQTVPLIDGKPISMEDFQALPDDVKKKINESMAAMQSEMESGMREITKLNQKVETAIEKLMQEVTVFVVTSRMHVLRNEYKECSDVLRYLDEVQEDIVDNVNNFLPAKSKPSGIEAMLPQIQKPSFQKYEANNLVNHQFMRGAPVIFEANPTYNNVFGHIEKRAYMGTLTTDFTMVQAGSLLRANGGFLIMELESVLMNPFVWEALKRALQNKLLYIEDVHTGMGYGTASLRPQPIPLDVKVILLGSYNMFHVVQNTDSKFNKIFKVRADFDYEVKRTKDTMQQYAQFIARVCAEEKLLPFTPQGVGSIVEYGEKYISHKNKLSLRFGPIVGIIKEADYWARKENKTIVSGNEVYKAFNEYRFRYNLYEEKTHESYSDDTILIDVGGQAAGQVNALAVYKIGDFSFGRPSRITAETFMGKAGVINIEREAKLSGKTHDKGVLILSGYLGRTFAQNYPLSLSISITFEQNYGGIDGDSASSTELYAILSSLSGIPINQGLAVTGSVNQKGEIQAIGGVNQKVEGFFDVCKTKGLTGDQGVLIPKSNVKNLMIKKNVIDAVKNKQFHIYSVATVEEGIAILTGRSVGEPDEEGNYPEDTIFGEVQQKLKKYLKKSMSLKKEFGDENNEEKT